MHASLLVLTQYNGRFPLTWRMSMQIKVSEEEIIKGASRVLKHILSKEFFKTIKID